VKNVKKNKMTIAVLPALLLASFSVLADSNYPAADFQPKVVFSDSSAASSAVPAGKAAAQESTDPNYPATNFQPKVVYNDSNYQHSSAAPAAAKSSSAASSSASASNEAADSADSAASEPAASSNNNNLLGLLALEKRRIRK
jgi:hypothetical protein